jgi:hypothetical protein
MKIVAAPGFTPAISGANAIRLLNGATDVLISGFDLPNCSTADANGLGACVCLDHLAIVTRIIIANCSMHDVASGSAVMLSYHQTIGGDDYATPNSLSEFSLKMAFKNCNFVRASLDGNEGASITFRGFNQPYVSNCVVNGGGLDARGIQFLNCFSFLCQDTESFNFVSPSGNNECFKARSWPSGSMPTYRTDGIFRRCIGHDAHKAFYSKDQGSVLHQKCEAYACTLAGYDAAANGGYPTWATYECNVAHDCPGDGINTGIGFLMRNNQQFWLRDNNSYNNGDLVNRVGNYVIQSGAPLDPSNVISP